VKTPTPRNRTTYFRGCQMAEHEPVKGDVYRHIKRGTVYTVIGVAELQMRADLVDGSELILYQGEDGKLWAREVTEFTDGRFEQELPEGLFLKDGVISFECNSCHNIAEWSGEPGEFDIDGTNVCGGSPYCLP
jgi:hypothetical protein